jgi:hypothetical protein
MGSVLFGSTAQFCNVLEFGHFTPKIKTPQERTDGIDLCQIVAMLCTIFIQEKLYFQTSRLKTWHRISAPPKAIHCSTSRM